MRIALLLGIGVLILAPGSLRLAYGCQEGRERARVVLPNCIGEKATVILNRALSENEQALPLRIELIDDGRQTNFALHGTRSCEGSMTSQAGLRYTGTWSYTRIGDTLIKVKFSLQPLQAFSLSMRPAAAAPNAEPDTHNDNP